MTVVFRVCHFFHCYIYNKEFIINNFSAYSSYKIKHMSQYCPLDQLGLTYEKKTGHEGFIYKIYKIYISYLYIYNLYIKIYIKLFCSVSLSLLFGEIWILYVKRKGKSKAVPLQAWSVPKSSRKLWFPDFMTTAQDGGKFVSLTPRPPLPPGLISVRGWVDPSILSMKNSKDTSWYRTSDLPICGTAP